MSAAPKLSKSETGRGVGLGKRAVPGIGVLVDVPTGLSWVHPSIAARQAGEMGLGLVALAPISKGDPVIFFGGKLMSWAEVCSLPEEMRDIPYQVSEDLFFGMHRWEDVGIGEKINHSCDPNCGFQSEMKLVAIRDIRPGDEVTMDYSTCSTMESYRMKCFCGSPKCRGTVLGTDWRNRRIQARLYDYFQPYLKEKIARQSAGALDRLFLVLRRRLNGLFGSREGVSYE